MVENEIEYQIAKTLLHTLKVRGGLTDKEYFEIKSTLLNYYNPFIESLKGDIEWAKE